MAEVSRKFVRIDVRTIEPGDRWREDRLEELTGERRGTTAYEFAVLSMKRWILRQRRNIGKPLVAWMEHGTLVFGDRGEAQDEYAQREDRRAMRNMRNALEAGRTLRESKFSPQDWSRIELDQQRRAFVYVMQRGEISVFTLEGAVSENTSSRVMRLLQREEEEEEVVEP